MMNFHFFIICNTEILVREIAQLKEKNVALTVNASFQLLRVKCVNRNETKDNIAYQCTKNMRRGYFN